MEVSDYFHAAAALPLGETAPITHCNRMLCGFQSMSRYFFYIFADLCAIIDGVWIRYWIYCIHHSEQHFAGH
jgi:hypothetical protein